MARYVFRLYVGLLTFLVMPAILAPYFSRRTGGEYGVGFLAKCVLLFKMIRNKGKITTASHYLEHVSMATRILSIPRSVEGVVVECGCYKGGSTANLSLICALCGRRLEVFDSFQGLPEPIDGDRSHLLPDVGVIHTYSKGAWQGNLDEVKENIAACGEISVCQFHEGFFEDTLPGFGRKCVFAFLDVDLVSSIRTCVRFLWPLLQSGCCVFTHEAPHLEVASVFFEKQWWRENLQCDAPGLIGAGSGVGLMLGSGYFRSDLGYTVKFLDTENWSKIPQLGLGQAAGPIQG
jgi:macrocin-O-methyltransferase TylF-like protien